MTMIRKRFIIFITLMTLAPVLSYGSVPVRIQDLSYFDGLKVNQVMGYGLVVGLQGTGDTRHSPLTGASLKNLLKNIGMEGEAIHSKNSAAVIVTAVLPPYLRVGDRVNVTISSIGDAKSLQGGILVQSPLRGADNEVYAVAQGPLSTTNAKRGRSIKTVATIPGGGVVEREINPVIVYRRSVLVEFSSVTGEELEKNRKAVSDKYPAIIPTIIGKKTLKIPIPQKTDLKKFLAEIAGITGGKIDSAKNGKGPIISAPESIYLVLKEPGYTLAESVLKAVTGKFPSSFPSLTDGGKIELLRPRGISLAEFLSGIEKLEVTPAYSARVVVNERDGTIVTGGEVRISEAMVSRKGLTVEIKETGAKGSAAHLKDTSTVKDLVDTMNSTGASTTDIIAILKALKDSGALHAELIVK